MAEIISEKIRVGVSACNAGARVRWNRAGWDRLEPLGREKSSFIWTPVCPEVMAGLGVPRDPIRLSGGTGTDVLAGEARVKSRKGTDVTEDLRSGCDACMDALRRAGVEAFVFMEGSPSCGVYRTTLKNQRLGKPPGVFGAALLREDLFLIPALDLESPVKWWDWRRRLHAFCWLRRLDLASKRCVYDAWHLLKFLCQEANNAEARRIGADLAAMPKRPSPEWIEGWRSRSLRLLRAPSTYPRIQSVMSKHFAYYRKHIGGEAETPAAGMAKYRFVDELLSMEKRAVNEDFLFAGTPVVFREARG